MFGSKIFQAWPIESTTCGARFRFYNWTIGSGDHCLQLFGSEGLCLPNNGVWHSRYWTETRLASPQLFAGRMLNDRKLTVEWQLLSHIYCTSCTSQPTICSKVLQSSATTLGLNRRAVMHTFMQTSTDKDFSLASLAVLFPQLWPGVSGLGEGSLYQVTCPNLSN